MAEILWYKLEDNAANTTVVDNAGNSLTGTSQANTNTMSVAGKVGNALNFDGAVDYILASDNVLFRFANTGFTISMWVNYDTTQTTTLITKSNLTTTGFAVTVASNAMSISIGNSVSIVSTASGITFSNATWTHLVITYTLVNPSGTGNILRFYKDGVLITTATNVLPMADNTTNSFSLGARSSGSAKTDGKIDDVRLFNRPLDQTEVNFLYNGGSGTAEPLDSRVTTILNEVGSKTEINAATKSGADSTNTDNNKTILAVPLGQKVKIIEFRKLASSPA
jgi:hypothetical protein